MDDSRPDRETRYLVPALAQGLRLLGLFSRERPTLAPPDIARELELSRATVFRLLTTLEHFGYVVRESDGRRFSLGPAVLGRGFAFLASRDLVEISRPVLEKLRDDTGLSAHLAIRDGTEIVYLLRCAAHRTISSSVQAGTRLPAHATVIGRMTLCELSDVELAALYPETRLPKFSEQTPRTLKDLRKLLDGDRARGWGVSQSFFESGVSAVAAPLRDQSGAIVGAINITAVDAQATLEELGGPMKDKVVAAAARIREWLVTQGAGRGR